MSAGSSIQDIRAAISCLEDQAAKSSDRGTQMALERVAIFLKGELRRREKLKTAHINRQKERHRVNELLGL